EQGRYDEAEGLFRQALAAWETSLGKEHPHVATAYTNLSCVHAARGRYQEAEALSRRALQIAEMTWGPEHPELVLPLKNLARDCHNLKRHAEARALYQRALAIQTKTLGPDHPEVLALQEEIALLWQEEEPTAAEDALRRTLAAREARLGREHLDVAL